MRARGRRRPPPPQPPPGGGPPPGTPPTRRRRRSPRSWTSAAVRAAALVAFVCLLAGCGGAPRSATGTHLYLAGNGELWDVDVAHQRVRRLERPTLDVGEVPHRILARGRRLIMGSAFGDSAYFLPSVSADRVWVVDVGSFSGARAVREVTVDGETVVPAITPPQHRSALAAGAGGPRLAARYGLDVWDPRTGRPLRHLTVDPETLGPTDGP